MIRQCAFWMAAMLATLAATSAWAAEDVFHAIPSDAFAFAAVNRISETSAKVEKLGKQVGAPPVKLLDLIKTFTGDIKGLDDTRSAALVLMLGKDAKEPKDPPTRVLLVPVTDYKKFLASWDAKPTGEIVEVTIAEETMLIGQRGDYAAMARKEVEDVESRPGLEKLLKAKRSIADEYPQQISWLNENEIVAVATSRGIKTFSQTTRDSLQHVKELFAQANADQDMLVGFEMYAKVLRTAEKEMDFIGVAARVDKQGNVHLAKRVCFTKGSKFSASLAKIKPAAKSPLTALPAGPFVVAGGGPWDDALSHSILALQFDFVKQNFKKTYGIDEKQAAELAKKSLEMPGGIHSVSVMMGPGQSGEPILSDTLAIYNVDDATKFLDQYAKYLSDMDEPGKNGKDAKKAKDAKKLFVVKRTEVGGRPALENEVAIPLPPQAPGTPDITGAMDKIFGGGGKMKILAVAIDQHNVALNFAGRAPMIMRTIASLKKPADSLATDPDIAKTAALLPAGSQWVGYFSPSGAVAFAKSFVDALGEDAGFGTPHFPDFPASPPIGVAAKATPGQLQIETVVPSSVLDALNTFISAFGDIERPEVP